MTQSFQVQATITGNSQAVNVGPRSSPSDLSWDPRKNTEQIPAGGGVSSVFNVSNALHPQEVFLAKDTGDEPQTFTCSMFVQGNTEELKAGLRAVGSLSWADTPTIIPPDTGVGFTVVRVVDNTTVAKMAMMVKDSDNS